jgi:hypothetical protein
MTVASLPTPRWRVVGPADDLLPTFGQRRVLLRDDDEIGIEDDGEPMLCV